eukprot:771349-Amorphochlora_amoeboformis.AAC.4
MSEVQSFLVGVLEEFKTYYQKVRDGRKPGLMPWERLLQHVVVTKGMAYQRMETAIMNLKGIMYLKKELGKHVEMKEDWSTDLVGCLCVDMCRV